MNFELKMFRFYCNETIINTGVGAYYPPGGEGGYFLVKDYWGCAAGSGRIFTAGLTIMGLHF